MTISSGAIPSPARSLALLNQLLEKHGPQVFGQIMQSLLAQTFQHVGYSVSPNAVGVPDFVAVKPSERRGFAIEAKTGGGPIVTLSERELEGVRSTGWTPVVAILLFPDVEPRWFFIDAHQLDPGRYRTQRLIRKLAVTLDFEANLGFRNTLGNRHATAMENPRALKQILADGPFDH